MRTFTELRRPLVLVTALLLAPVASGAIPTLVEVRAHNFEVMTTEGKRVPLGNLVPDGRPAVVEFWATWCAPCCKTIPHLIELSKRYGDARLAVLGLTVESPVTDTAKVASEMGINYAVAFAPRELFQFMNRREQVGVPKLIIYDAAGNVVEHILTYSPFTNRRIESAVSRAFTAK